ncbi:2-oxoglutarate dehydrogenase complex dihydrolipoyllysine-residue succinyltransferase [Corallococcus aberystwythensis]|uniref:Dihydrolipoyllysine-residue succinyltransferase component of 2-oxoglutarate dehydrogenase complex n=2 Tax=Corallococcus TaxID=83461 RepID=A0A3A8Q8Z6_9BACT|nr:2-oxoglutarate dehydrogenase complex dihydrolipoyllysine-residue succinyltransferase [Corallococcus aberystwythensis]RKH65153.1 2-oxoglutarate dehydrogenase complex dihydrolipoyllysine-residue succinyltransferase [Corallococcus aberystwythensis]
MAVELKVPPLGESITEAVVGKWNKKQGESVSADEPLVVLETDKVTIDVPSPAAGSIASIAFKEGDKVRVGDVLGTIEAGAGAAASPAAAAATPAPAQAAAPVTSAGGQAQSDARITPTAKKMAEENRVDVGQLKGSGTGGRIMKEDVQGQLNRPAAAPSAPPAPAAPSGPRPNAAREERVRMTPLRKRVAERLLQAQSNAALLTTFNEVDMGEVMALRKKYNDKFQAKHGVKLGFMSFFIRASVEALKAFPQINAEIDGEDVIFKHYYDIGVAVSGSRGLVVPVVRDADKLSLAELEKTVGDYGGRARNDKLTMSDLTGGTFTITNGGIFGSMLSTPILNPPQTGILGMHNIVERPVARDGQVVIRPIMYIALTYDHRLVDGREAVQFLVRVKECIEDPERLLLDI